MVNQLLAVDQQVDVGGSYICHLFRQINSRGIWFGDDPLSFSMPLLMLQLSLISIITRSIYILLKPFGQPMIVSQILGGVILGPSVLGSNSAFANKVFPSKGKTVLDTLSVFGLMVFIFLVGVKMDPTMVLKSGKRPLAIGILGFFVPYGLAGSVAFILNHFLSLDHSISKILPSLVALQSMTAFPVIVCFLSELKILNSEIGRLASSSSIICDVCHWTIMTLTFAAKIAKGRSVFSFIGSFLSCAFLIILVVFGIRPAALWAIRRTPEGKPVNEIYIFGLLVALLGCGFMGEVIGLSALFGSFLLGLAIPDGPPLGAALVERLDCFVSILLMPIFFAICGLKTDVFAIQKLENVGVIQLVVFVAFVGKILGTMLPPLICRMPLRDAFSFAFIMNSKGIVEVAMLNDLKKANVMSEECFAIMIISVVAITGVISPLVKTLYDPSRGFLAYRRRTIFHNKHKEELRVLACIHTQDHAQAILNLLDTSNPTKESPINLVVLHLVKLVGRASSLLVAHRACEKPSVNPTQSERIFNAFKKLEEKYHGFVTVNCFKGISPYSTMHNDVCSLALEKRTSFIIIPFHKQCILGEKLETCFYLRHINKNVLEKAPCSVGILVDHGTQKRSRYVVSQTSVYRVAVIFFGGRDDREALAYGGRMVENEIVRLKIVRICSSVEIVKGYERSRMLDDEILSEFKHKAQWNERIFYQEEMVTEGAGVIALIRMMENNYDLVMVGRHHGESQVLSELANWNESGELGTIGEILAASEFKLWASVLVVQQQRKVWGMHDPEESTHLRKINF